MRFKLINIIICLISIQLYCQSNNYVDWENTNNFIKHNLNNVSVYSYEIKKNGKIKKDSLLLKNYVFDKEKSTINGINHNSLFINHGGGSKRLYYSFLNQYVKDSLLSKRIDEEILDKKRKSYEIKFIENITEYKYDSLNRKIEELSYSKINTVNFYSKKDTLSRFISIQSPKRIEYEYDNKNRIIKQFKSTDSTIYHSKFDMKSDFKSSRSCVYCEEKYFQQEWKYQDSNLIEQTNYTYKKEKHTKKNYFYDEDANLIQQIDSTGWYFSEGKPYLDSTKDIAYNKNGKVITSIEKSDKTFKKHHYKTIIYFNKENFMVKREEYSEGKIDVHNYNYKNSKLISKTTNYGESDIIKFEYLYNEKGLIKEQKHFINNRLVEIERYYYN
jgi:hypothetical protein